MKIYNTLTRKKEDFVPIEPGKARIYACGPTVYNYIHIGNARPICVFDVLRRYLEYRGYEVKFVQNFTDIDDKLIKKANEEGITVPEVAERYIAEYKTDAAGLGVRPANIHPRATEVVPDIIRIIETLIEKGFAYESHGDVYFRVHKFPDYGKLSHMPIEDLESGARVDVSEIKEDPLDFALWKSAKPGEPFWESPWGQGRPGWHIECTAMIQKYLGETIDIHCGGQDLVFPHHEDEIAQGECCTGHAYAHYWMHNGFINVDNQKMSKSLGNFFTVREVAEKFGYEPIKYLMLSSHYRSPISFSSGLIEEAHRGLKRLYTALDGRTGDGAEVDWSEPFAARFKAAMDDDFNTAQAVAVLFELAGEINRTGSSALVRQLLALGRILNILGRDPEAFLRGAVKSGDEARIESLVAERAAAKKARDFAKADKIRADLLAEGIELLDGPQGTTWRRL